MAKQRTCKKCQAAITRYSTTGLCLDCVHERKRRRQGPTTEVTGGRNVIEIVKRTTKLVSTLDELVRVCEIDLGANELLEWTANAWAGASSDDDQKFQVKARLRPKVEILSLKAEIASLLADAKKKVAARLSVFKPKKAQYSLLLDIPDLHAGKLAWKEETGHANYDTKIAIALFERAVEVLMARVSGFAFREVVVVIGNDLMNVDNRNNTTFKGTPQSSDSRFQKTFVLVRRMVSRTIERVQRRFKCKVKVIVLPGNHDTMASWHLGDSISCFFAKTKGIVIDNQPRSRKYHLFGRNLWMFTHGDKGKRTKYPNVMAAEEPVLWGKSKHREVHTGHLHQERVNEHPGVTVLTASALCSTDAWHSEEQYIGMRRAATARVYHAAEGHVATAVFTVQE